MPKVSISLPKDVLLLLGTNSSEVSMRIKEFALRLGRSIGNIEASAKILLKLLSRLLEEIELLLRKDVNEIQLTDLSRLVVDIELVAELLKSNVITLAEKNVLDYILVRAKKIKTQINFEYEFLKQMYKLSVPIRYEKAKEAINAMKDLLEIYQKYYLSEQVINLALLVLKLSIGILDMLSLLERVYDDVIKKLKEQEKRVMQEHSKMYGKVRESVMHKAPSTYM